MIRKTQVILLFAKRQGLFPAVPVSPPGLHTNLSRVAAFGKREVRGGGGGGGQGLQTL